MFVFMGADHKVGTSQIVHSLAEIFAKRVNKEVLVLGLSNKPDDEFISPTEKSIDSLREHITGNYVSLEEIEQAKYFAGGYSFIPGPRDILRYRHYSVNEVSLLLKQLDSENRYLILIDVGSEVDNPLAMSAIQSARHLLTVVTDQRPIFTELERKMKQVITPAFNITNHQLQFIMNKFNQDLSKANEQLQVIKGTTIGVVPQSGAGSYSELERTPLSLQDAVVEQHLIELARILAKKEDCSFVEIEKKPSILGKFSLFSR